MKDIFKKFVEDETEIITTEDLNLDEQVTTNKPSDTFDLSKSIDSEKRTDSSMPSHGRNVVFIAEPSTEEYSEKIMNSIKKNELVVVNFKNVSEEQATHILDRISGAIYALEGQIVQITGEIVVCIPNNYLLNLDEDNQF